MERHVTTGESPEAATAARPDDDKGWMTREVLRMVSVYDKAGVASRDRLEDAPVRYHPQNVMADFRAIIVLARVPREVPKGNVARKFHQAVGTVAAQDAVIAFLKSRGYQSRVIGSRSTVVSLPRLGERAGVGQISPFSTLAIKGHGLRAVLSAIITTAPLQSSPLVADACATPGSCLKRCPAFGADGVFDRSKCKSCGACVKSCTAA